MKPISATLAFNLDTSLIQAALPLFEAEQIDAIEWSFDSLYQRESLPDWFSELISTYGDADKLIGHGVFFSLFSGKWLPEQAQWLAHLRELTQTFRFSHISEHFGFLTGTDFHKGAPLGVPFSADCLAIGQDRLRRIADACGCPVGLENLAFSTHLPAVKAHGAFLEQLIEPVNGFIILDLHNLYCQLANFDLSLDDLLPHYPLHRVREIHISGGSWEPSPFRPAPGVRRDTHDDRVPEAVFALLESVMPRCPNLLFVTLEQLGTALHTPVSQLGLQEDFRRMRGYVLAENQRRLENLVTGPLEDFIPNLSEIPSTPLENMDLYAQQIALSNILEKSDDLDMVKVRLAKSGLAHSAWDIEHWDMAMLETAYLIAQKWKSGF